MYGALWPRRITGVWRPSEHAMFTWYVRSEQFFLSAVPVADEAGCFEPGFSSVSTVIKWISVRSHARHVTLHLRGLCWIARVCWG